MTFDGIASKFLLFADCWGGVGVGVEGDGGVGGIMTVLQQDLNRLTVGVQVRHVQPLKARF